VAVLPGVVAGSESDTILRDLVQAPGAVELVPVPAELLGQVANGPLPDGLADVAPLLDGGDVAGVSTSSDDVTGSPVLELTLTESAARAFDDFGAAHLGEQVAIVVDGAIITAPVLNAPRFEGQISITGDFTTDEAARLASILAWPLPLEIREVAWAACG
jgi:preprotein translocase subunit SecD